MKKKKDNKVQFYHYIDEGGVDSLYAQCGQFLVESLTEVEKTGKIDGGTEVEIGKLLSLAGLGSLKIDGQISIDRLKSESLKSVFRVEQRIPIVINYLREQGELYEPTQAHSVIKEDGYALIESRFLTPSFSEVIQMSKIDPTQVMMAKTFQDPDLLKPQGFVTFTSHVKSGKITMGTSLSKYQTGLQHLMVMWETAEGDQRKVQLRVFGNLTRKGKGDYYLKPFAIAQAK